MRTELTVEEMERDREHGFVVIEDLLDPDELERWREAIDAAVERRRRSSGHPTKSHEFQASQSGEVPKKVREHLDYYERVFVQQVNLWASDDGARQLVLDERLGRLAAELAGVDGIRLYHDQALYKPPWGNPTAFHLDLPYWSFTDPDALSLWIALDDATMAAASILCPGATRPGIPAMSSPSASTSAPCSTSIPSGTTPTLSPAPYELAGPRSTAVSRPTAPAPT